MAAPFRLAFNLPFDDAVAQSRARLGRVLLPQQYYHEARQDMRRASFTVSGLASLSQIEGVLVSLNAAIAKGDSFATWKLWAEAQGWGLPNGRIETIFRTNVQTAYAQGHWRQFLETKGTRPFLMYSAINDSRVRANHAAMDGYVAHIADPIWKAWTPPCGYNCRCTLIALSERQAKARGLGKKSAPAVKPDPGFGHGDPEALVLSNLDKATRDRLTKIDPLLAKKIAPKLVPPKTPPQPAPKPPPAVRRKPWNPAGDCGAYHEEFFADAPDHILDAIDKLGAEASGGVHRPNGNEPAHYHPTFRRIVMWQDAATSKGVARERHTWTHEFGHYMDHMLGLKWMKKAKAATLRGPAAGNIRRAEFRSSARDFQVARYEDARDATAVLDTPKKMQKVADAYRDAYKDMIAQGAGPSQDAYIHRRMKALGLDSFDAHTQLGTHSDLRALSDDDRRKRLLRITVALEQRDLQEFLNQVLGTRYEHRMHSIGRKGVLGNVSDLIGAMTQDRIGGQPNNGWGHDSAYWTKWVGCAETEMFANLTSMHAIGSPFWSRLGDLIAPKTSALFRKILTTEIHP